jgi:hypothetical protein
MSIVALTPSPGQELKVHRRFIALYISQSTTNRLLVLHATPCNAVLFISFPDIRLWVASHAFIWSMKLSLSSWNFSETTSHRSIRSLKPFSNASTAVVPSTGLSALPTSYLAELSLTVCLDSNVHELFRGMGDRIATEFDVRTCSKSILAMIMQNN